MQKMMHLAAQYLAAAGISFVEKQEDDSHTNFGFTPAMGLMTTHPLSDSGDVLSLDYKRFALIWSSPKGNSSFNLDGATHKQVLAWVQETSQNALKRRYVYDLHYELPYEFDDHFVFELLDKNALQALLGQRILIQNVLEKVLKDNYLKSPIRVWPHHFDTGAYASLNNDSDIYVGFGLAIPDTLCNEHYLYISGYNDRGAIDTANFASLDKGEWKNEGFKGAILPVAGLTEPEAVQFFQQAITIYNERGHT